MKPGLPNEKREDNQKWRRMFAQHSGFAPRAKASLPQRGLGPGPMQGPGRVLLPSPGPFAVAFSPGHP